MNLFWILIIIIAGLIVLNNIFIMIYCILQEIKDNKKEEYNHDAAGGDGEDESIGTLRKLYRWLNAYLYGWMRYNIIKTGNIPSYRLRLFFYKYVYRMKISRRTVIFSHCEIRTPWKIHIGRSTIAGNCILDGRNGLFIEDDVVLGTGVHIWTEEHELNDPYFRVMPQNKQSVRIRRHAWVCSDTTLLPGVIVGEGAVVASKACVTKDCGEYGVYAGIPAKKIADRNRNLKYKLPGKPTWHFY